MNYILHVSGHMARAGAQTMLMNLYRNIDRRLYQFHFLVFSKEVGDFDDEIYALGGEIIYIDSKNVISRTIAIYNFLRKNSGKYQIIHSHTNLSSGLTLFGAYLAGIRHRITHSHSSKSGSNPSFVFKLYEKLSKLLIASCSTAFIACGELASDFLFPKNTKSLILLSSVNVRENRRLKIQDKFPQNGYQGLKIIQVGRLEKVKNHDFAIELASFMKAQGLKFKLFFIGEGELLNDLEKLVMQQELNDSVIFLGLRKDVLNIMKQSDVLLMPSLYEGFPVVLAESQSVGLRAVVSDNVSPEVDLGVGLVKFCSLDSSLEEWTNLLTNVNHDSLIDSEREIMLIQKGIDLVENTKRLESLYKSMHN